MNETINFFAMGGYAFYLWLAYGMAVFVFILNIYLPKIKYKKMTRQLREEISNEAKGNEQSS